MTNSDSEMYYNQAMSLLGQGEVQKSLEFFEKTLSVDDQYSPAWNNMGIAFLDLKQYRQAIECFDKVILLNANDSMPWYNKGYALLILEEYDDSVNAFRIFLSRYPKKDDFYKFALYLQSEGFYNLKEYDQARQSLEDALKIDKKFNEARELLNKVSKELK
jgi:lipoprotein NlpI